MNLAIRYRDGPITSIEGDDPLEVLWLTLALGQHGTMSEKDRNGLFAEIDRRLNGPDDAEESE